jgi:hypothetical protein
MITEPSTLATDYALAALSAWLGLRLRRHARQTHQRAIDLWALAFAATAIGSFAGGTYHGFVTALPPLAAAVTWKIATIAVGVGACLLLSAVVVSSLRGRTRRPLLIMVWAQLAAYAAWMLGHDDFVYVIIEYGSAMIAILFLQLFLSRSNVARRWIVAGIGATLAAAAVQQSGFDVHRHLNHNDLQHLIQMFGIWLLYQGGMRLIDAPAGSSPEQPEQRSAVHRDRGKEYDLERRLP